MNPLCLNNVPTVTVTYIKNNSLLVCSSCKDQNGFFLMSGANIAVCHDQEITKPNIDGTNCFMLQCKNCKVVNVFGINAVLVKAKLY